MAIPDMNYATREELLETAKMLVKSIELRFGTTIPVLTKSLDDKLNGVASKYDKQVDSIQGAFESHIKRLGNMEMDLGVSLGRMVKDEVGLMVASELTKRITSIQECFDKQLCCVQEEYATQVAKLEDRYNTEIGLIKSVVEQSMLQIKELLSSISIPAPQVQVNVPEQQVPIINVSQPDIDIHVPEQQAPVVNVTVPARRVKKNISYDEYNRPIEITEMEGS